MYDDHHVQVGLSLVAWMSCRNVSFPSNTPGKTCKEVFLSILSVVWCVTPGLRTALTRDLQRSGVKVIEAMDGIWELTGSPRSASALYANKDTETAQERLRQELLQANDKIPERYASDIDSLVCD